MKRILLVSIAAGFLFFGVGLYLAHGEETPQGLPSGPNKPLQPNGSGGFPQHYTVPRISRTDPLMRKRDSKTCQEYLAICERSCRERGTLFKFQCIGQEFQPFEDHFRCTCADDFFVHVQRTRPEQVQVRQEAPANQEEHK